MAYDIEGFLKDIPLALAGALLTVCVLGALVAIVIDKEGPGLGGSWGGFGGTRTNWHLSKSLGLIILSALFAIVFTVVAFESAKHTTTQLPGPIQLCSGQPPTCIDVAVTPKKSEAASTPQASGNSNQPLPTPVPIPAPGRPKE